MFARLLLSPRYLASVPKAPSEGVSVLFSTGFPALDRDATARLLVTLGIIHLLGGPARSSTVLSGTFALTAQMRGYATVRRCYSLGYSLAAGSGGSPLPAL